jgi:topoisomerase IA-like protein
LNVEGIDKKISESDLDIELAKEIIEKTDQKNKGLGQFVNGDMEYTIIDGKYGRCIKIINRKHKKPKAKFVSFPKDLELKDATLEKIEKIVMEEQSKPKKKYNKYNKKK